MLLGCFSLFLSVVWSFSSHWRWPSVFPEAFSFQTWIKLAPNLVLFLGDSILIASLTTLSAIIIAIAWFQTEKRDNAMDGKLLPFAICIPLFIPQIGFLFGLNSVFLKTGLSGSWFACNLVSFAVCIPICFHSDGQSVAVVGSKNFKISFSFRVGPLKQLLF